MHGDRSNRSTVNVLNFYGVLKEIPSDMTSYEIVNKLKQISEDFADYLGTYSLGPWFLKALFHDRTYNTTEELYSGASKGDAHLFYVYSLDGNNYSDTVTRETAFFLEIYIEDDRIYVEIQMPITEEYICKIDGIK